jgi:hypothetical protein
MVLPARRQIEPADPQPADSPDGENTSVITGGIYSNSGREGGNRLSFANHITMKNRLSSYAQQANAIVVEQIKNR